MNVAEALREAGLPKEAVADGWAEIRACASCERDERRVPEHVREIVRLWKQHGRLLPIELWRA